MAALAASVPQWVPEDDLLLKSAVEGGASLEALAKGAVRFSRKFTVWELRDRWHSLLYDPDVSEKASARMVEVEIAGMTGTSSRFNKYGLSKERAEVSPKRKVDSVRRLYRAMRKKMCRSPGLSFLGASDANYVGLGGGCQENRACDGQPPDGSCMFGEHNQNNFGFFDQDSSQKDIPYINRDRLTDFENCTRVEHMASSHAMPESSSPFHMGKISSPLPSMPIWKAIEDVSAPEMPIDASFEERDKGQGKEKASVNPDDMDSDKACSSGMDAIHDLVNLSDSLLNFANEDEMLFMEADGKDPLENSCYDSLNSLLVPSPAAHGELPDATETQPLASDTIIGTTEGACHAELGVITERFSSDIEQFSHVCSEINAQSSTSGANTESCQSRDEEMECILNSEDPEIPCNDNVYLTNECSSPVETSGEVRYMSSLYPNRKDGKQEIGLMKKEENQMPSITAFRMGVNMLPVGSPGHQLVTCGGVSSALGTRKGRNANGDPGQHGLVMASSTSTKTGVLKEEPLVACNAMDLPFHERASSPIKAISVSEVDDTALDPEGSGSDVGDDDDVPSFSDIEAMILEMDLCPDDSDSCISREVSRYQNEITQRTIMRLEQCAQSSIQRGIASRGAFAILYGRHSKHYIKGTEVILGRATDDMDVDIDLGKEGPANRISRRQALIKMKGDGSFLLKNLGKSPIFVNGREVAIGQSMSLSSSSLIEIRELAFVFEVNKKSVRQHLANVTKNHGGKNVKFEWTEEGGPMKEAKVSTV